MNAPFYTFGLFGDETSLIVAFVIGLGFGICLELAGFGSARKLTAQFYFSDLSVLKVMFTAIVTAMAGLYVVSRLGLVDLSLVHLTPTFILPQIVGGLLLGVGFVIGGYCPGTSVVSAATGRIDAIVYLLGIMAGLFGFGEIYPHIAGWLQTTPMGELTIPGWTGLPYGLVVFGVVVMAIGAFIAAELAEKIIGGVTPGPGSLTGSPRPLNAARLLMLGLFAVGAFAAVGGNPYREGRVTIDTRELARLSSATADRLAPAELADWLVTGRADYVLIDLRNAEEFATHRIPGARHVPLAKLTDEVASRSEKIVLYGKDDVPAAQAWILLKAQGFKSVHTLAGGLDAWDAEVLFPAQSAEDTPETKAAFARSSALAKHFGGTPRGVTSGSTDKMPALTTPPPPLDTSATPDAAPKKKKREGC